MNPELKKALQEFAVAEQMHQKADSIYYRAKKRLEAISSPAVPPLTQKAQLVTDVLTRRNAKIKTA
jgi:hypothetical protein